MDNYIKLLVPLLDKLVWPFALVIFLLLFRSDLRSVLKRISNADCIDVKLGSLSFKAEAMREILTSLNSQFPESTVNRSEVTALISSKLRAIQGSIEHHLTKSDVRVHPRYSFQDEIEITRHDGSIQKGMSIDISEAGLCFKSKARLNWNEIARVKPLHTTATAPVLWPETLQIIRIEPIGGEFYYGAIVA